MTALAPDRVFVRMYKNILGDCFLIRLEKDGHDTTHILIDCGILQGTPNGGAIMRNAVEDIYKETKGQPLDLVVVTHEHHDHISGFQYAKKEFEEGGMNALWLAWTEDPTDPDGIALQKEFGDGFAILGALAHKLGLANPAMGQDIDEILGLVGFSGTLPAFDEQTKEPKARGSRAIYQNLYQWAGAQNTRFLSPGDVLNTPAAADAAKPSLCAYVLGPPRDLARLKNDLPSTVNPETYFKLKASDGKPALDVIPGKAPFAKSDFWRKAQDIENYTSNDGSLEALTKARYFAETSPDQGFEKKAPLGHRRIGNLDRSIFSTLALRMDNKTNNTSLVLAFELPDGGVMLFAADAQVGNWKSWKDVTFRDSRDGPPLPIKSDDLLARTCLYKVGHHGSHNATLAAEGLEKMHGRDFVAMIPTDAEFALKQGAGWLMPNPHVEKALKAKGKILRGDQDIDDVPGAREDNDKLYVEYQVYPRVTATP